MKERIKQIRKGKKLSQTKFGEILGVSRDVISNYEMGRVEPTELFIGHLCNTFSVNEQWLRTGEGSMFNESEKSLFDELSNEYKLSSTERALIESFLELSPDGRKAVAGYIKTAAKRMTAADSKRDNLIEQQLSKLNRTIADTAPDTVPAQTK